MIRKHARLAYEVAKIPLSTTTPSYLYISFETSQHHRGHLCDAVVDCRISFQQCKGWILSHQIQALVCALLVQKPCSASDDAERVGACRCGRLAALAARRQVVCAVLTDDDSPICKRTSTIFASTVRTNIILVSSWNANACTNDTVPTL